MDDEAIRALIVRLSRRHPSGGRVVERAALLAEGADFAAVARWIDAHDGKPETVVRAAPRGLHGVRPSGDAGAADQAPLRFVLPAGSLD